MCMGLLDAALKRILRGCPRLRILNLRCCKLLSDESLWALASRDREPPSELTHLNLSCCHFSESAVLGVVRRYSSTLRVLDLCYCSHLSRQFVTALTKGGEC